MEIREDVDVVWLQGSLVPCSCIACRDKVTDRKLNSVFLVCVSIKVCHNFDFGLMNPSSCLLDDELILAVLVNYRCQEQQR